MTKINSLDFTFYRFMIYYFDLSWNIDALLSLYLDRDGDTLLSGNILADLLAVVASAVVLQVHDPTLHVSYTLESFL